MRAVSVGSESVSRMMPNTARIAADTSVIAREWRLNQSSVRVSLPIASPTARNDTPSPSEYATSRMVERARLSPRAAKPSTLPRIGPMHGVHPRPNAAPATGAATGPKRSRCGWKRNSW